MRPTLTYKTSCQFLRIWSSVFVLYDLDWSTHRNYQGMGNIRQRSITDQQQDFVHYLVKENKNATEAARLAGYAHPKQSAYTLTRSPVVMAAMRLARQTTYQGELASLAANTLRQVMIDQDAPAAAKVSAARTALELAGDLGRNADDMTAGKSLAEMSPDELARLIDRWEDERSSIAKDITPQNKTQEDAEAL